MIFRWLKNRKRRRLLAEAFPQAWYDILHANVHRYARLPADEQAKVRDYVRIFVAEKNWEGCGGLQINDEIRVTVAALVAILVLGLGEQYFDHVLSILVYHGAYVAPGQAVAGTAGVIEGDSARAGEAWYRGPVVLGWSDALAGARERNPGRNLVFHEFAHQLDMLNGRAVDGTPPMQSAAQFRRWNEVVPSHYRQLLDDCQRGHRTLLDCYGATNIGEFFAVATEAFFEQSSALQQRHPALYEVFREYYGQDPAARGEKHDGGGHGPTSSRL
jgi:hypothetical protein